MIKRIAPLFVLLLICLNSLAIDQWPTTNGAFGAGHYSSLKQIDKKNISQLKQQWVYHTGDFSNGTKGIDQTAFEATPIYFQNALYTCTPFNRVIALNPGNGKLLWQFDPKMDLKKGSTQGGFICRGVSSWTNPKLPDNTACKHTIFTATQDARLIALDAKSGSLCKNFGENGQIKLQENVLRELSDQELLDLHIAKEMWPKIREHWSIQMGSNSAPAVINGKVIVGMALADNFITHMPDGVVRAYEADTGKLAWSWNPVPKKMRGLVGAMNVWAPMSVDIENNTVLVGTSSPSPDYYGVMRQKDFPYADSIVTLDARTGQPKWHYQTVHHNLFDYDIASAPTAVNIKHQGETKSVVIQATKTGFIFVLDRLTGKSLFPVLEQKVPTSDIPGEVAAVTQPIPLLPKPLIDLHLTEEAMWGLALIDKYLCKRKFREYRYDGIFTPASVRGSLEFPFTGGGIIWGGVAFSPESNLLIVNYSRIGQVIKLLPRAEAEKMGYQTYGLSPMFGTPYALYRIPFLSIFGVPCNAPPWGGLAAIDMDSGELKWNIPFGSVKKWFFRSLSRWGSPNLGGSLVTGSGIIFIGASMDNTFHAYDVNNGKLLWQTNLPAQGASTPMTYEYQGKQYILISAGGSRGVSDQLRGDAIVVYSLE